MSTSESPVASPAPGWSRRMPRDERVFLWLILCSVLAMSLFAIGWLIWGSQNVPTASYRTTPTAWAAKVNAFYEKYKGADGKAHVPPGTDAYVMATRYVFYPDLVVKAGTQYQIWISSVDVLHGFSIVGNNENLSLEIAPEHAIGPKLTMPTTPGTYLVVCNEYCGLGHHGMLGHIIVER